MMRRSNTPYKLLGEQLAFIRKRVKESVAEVAGAVEIDADRLARIERGELRPSEDILLLLVTHFNIKDDQAAKLWELAGYADNKQAVFDAGMKDIPEPHQTLMLVPMDNRVIYTDMLHVMINNYGVVLNFMQGSGPDGQPVAAARVGMSIEHAKSVLEVLKATLEQAEAPKMQRALPAPKKNRPDLNS